jgi:putative ABC transport system substrate-binding protein
VLFNPATSAPFVQDYLGSFKTAAASVGVEAIIAPVNDMSEIQSQVTTQALEPNIGLVVIPDALTQHYLAEIAALSARYRIPAINWSRSFPDIGGLISYGPFLVDEYRRAAAYIDRILKGEKPSDLPVQAPVKFELVINLKTAKAFGLDVPPTLLAQADEVIE